MIIYNTLTRRKEKFKPIVPGEVSMYVCGQTVYNYIHIGNARFYVAFDAIRRYLEYKGYRVTYAQNFTDVDDKIIKRSLEEGISPEEVAQKYIDATLEDIKALNVKSATVAPKATEEIPGMIEMISKLVESGFAYEANGSVFFDTGKFENYGKLSKKNIGELEAGARVELNADKRSPTDFVLWKPHKPGEPKWESPWGEGRPGWHIECSAMVKKYLGETIDIHGGGNDLIFPHHENEIAQSEAANGVPLANYWMHNGPLTMNRKKMSKSLGNFYTFREVAEKFPNDVIRFYLVSGHYRMPMEYGEALLAAAQSGLSRIKNARETLDFIIENSSADSIGDEEKNLVAEADSYRINFEAAMDDDFNTADAVSAIFEFIRFINSRIDINKPNDSSREFAEALRDKLDLLGSVLGLNLLSERQSDAEIDALVSQRQEARKRRDFAEADRIRDFLSGRGIALEDSASGVRWFYAGSRA